MQQLQRNRDQLRKIKVPIEYGAELRIPPIRAMADLGEDVYFASIVELNKRLRAKEFSVSRTDPRVLRPSRELAPRYNALALSLRESAMRKAADVDGDLKRERYRGPLQGIPFGAKDLLSVAGQITTLGRETLRGSGLRLRCHRDHEACEDGRDSHRKLSMVELAGGGGYRYASASLFGRGDQSLGSVALVGRIIERFGKRSCCGLGDVRDRV